MTAIGRIIWGPGSFPGETYTYDMGNFTDYGTPLSDSNNAMAYVFSLPKSGTITKVGLFINLFIGNPPSYKVGLTTISNGVPQQTAYGGGSINDYDPDSTGWKWITLDTPSSGSAGDIVCVHIYPGASAPNISNYVEVSDFELFANTMPWFRRYLTSWGWGSATLPFGIQYDDDSIAGFPIVDMASEVVTSSSTPDEVGNIFYVPIEMKVVGIRFFSCYAETDSSFTVYLYDDDDNILGQIDIDEYDTGGGYDNMDLYFGEEIQLYTDVPYRLTIKGTSTGDVIVEGFDFNSATDRNTMTYPESERWYKTERSDSGAWTDTDTSIINMALIVSDISSGTSGSGAGPGATGYYGFIG